MNIDGLFHSPADRIAAFADAQLHLYRHDPSLQDYFMMLQLDSLASPRVSFHNQSASDLLISCAIRTADKMNQFRSKPKLKADVLFCPMPESSRKTEALLLVRTLLGLVKTDATILCLLPAGAPCRKKLDAQLAAAGRLGQVTFVDPVAPLNRMDARLRRMVSKGRGRRAFEKTVEILEPHGLNPGLEVKDHFQYIAHFVEAWERMAPWVEFDSVVARCHWHALCSPVCRTARQRGKPVVTFQQGVIGHTLDVPVTATKYVAFGHSSASFLARVNHHFFQEVGIPEPPVEYVEGGSLIDTVNVLQDQFELKTLLMVDVQVNPGDFYGIASQCQALFRLAEKLLAADLPLRRLIIRPHPYWSDLDVESVKNLVREHSARCELSHPAWSLEDDLRRSSVAVGIFSGALTVASACGLPTFFLKTKHGFMTEDLECFSAGQIMLPEDAFREISRIMRDQLAYADARKTALNNAHQYYANGTNLDFSASFFERLLRNEVPPKHAERSLQ